jgi:hypothetical protein
MTKSRKELAAAKMYLGLINTRIVYKERGKPRRASRQEVMIRSNAVAALKGDIAAAEILLKLHKYSKTNGDIKQQ